MLAGNLVDTALDGFLEPKIIPVQRQHLLGADRVEDPLRELDFAPEQAAIEAVRPPDRGGVDQPEIVVLLGIPGPDVRADPRPGEAVNSLLQRPVILAGRSAVDEDQQLARVDPHPLPNGLTVLELLHKLRDAIDQDVLVIDRRQALDTRRNLQPVSIMLISSSIY
jgi:hypothetical protein